MRYLFFLLFTVMIFTACQKSETETISADAKRYPLRGKIISVDKTKKKASIVHEEIPGYMEAMTMDFPIKNEDVLNTLSKDAEISGELVVDNANGTYWLEISSVSAVDPNNPAPATNEDSVKPGQEVPNFKLTNQDGKPISLRDFRGKALAITFIYTRCPIPDYCILMSKNFSDLAIQINNNVEMKDKIRLLSITFDPQTDTPETLRKYGLGYLGKDAKPDFTVWQLATGTEQEIKGVADFFGLFYKTDEKDKGLINHSLRTIVIDADGKVQKVFSGNEWTNEDLLNALESTIK